MLARVFGNVLYALERHTYDDDSHSSAAFRKEKQQVYVRARLFCADTRRSRHAPSRRDHQYRISQADFGEGGESHGDKRLCKRNTVSCKCICVRGCRMRLLLCGLCYQKTDGKVRKLFGLYKFCSADSLFHAGFNYFHSDLYPLCPLGDSRGHFGSLYGRYAGKLKRKN